MNILFLTLTATKPPSETGVKPGSIILPPAKPTKTLEPETTLRPAPKHSLTEIEKVEKKSPPSTEPPKSSTREKKKRGRPSSSSKLSVSEKSSEIGTLGYFIRKFYKFIKNNYIFII